MPRIPALFLCLILTALAALPARSVELVMVEQPGCHYCRAWKEVIAPIYPKTAEGEFAPLRMVDIRDTDKAGLTLDSRVVFTPTFLLVKDGQEIARMEGYSGEDFFWPLLERMLTRNTDFSADPPAATN